MDSVIRVVAMYLFLMLIFRIAGKRTLAEADTFDFLTLLIISETTQQAMVNHDHSMTNAFILITTLIGISIAMSLIRLRSKTFTKLVDDMPLVLLANGRPLQERMKKMRVDQDDILEAAREKRGLERLEQVKYAVLERTGEITIIPASAV